MPTTVMNGMMIHSVGTVSGLARCSIIERKPMTRKIAPNRTAATRKRLAPMKPTTEVTWLWLMAAAAEKPTPVMAKAKTDSMMESELLEAQWKPPSTSTRLMKSANRRSA